MSNPQRAQPFLGFAQEDPPFYGPDALPQWEARLKELEALPDGTWGKAEEIRYVRKMLVLLRRDAKKYRYDRR